MNKKGKSSGNTRTTGSPEDAAQLGSGASGAPDGDVQHHDLEGAVPENQPVEVDAGGLGDSDLGAAGQDPAFAEVSDGQTTQAPEVNSEDPAAPGAGDTVVVASMEQAAGIDAIDAATHGSEGKAGFVPEDLELNIERAAQAASAAYGGFGFFTPNFADPVDDVLRLAAAFVRTWPDAPAEAIPSHLQRKGGFSDVPIAGKHELAAWRIFAYVLTQLDRLDATPAPPKPAAGGLQLEQALVPEPGPFEAGGFSVR